MDIRLYNVPPRLTPAAIKRGLKKLVFDQARKKGEPFDFLVVLDKFQEDLDWEKYDGTEKTIYNSGLLTIPYPEVGEAVLDFVNMPDTLFTIGDKNGTPFPLGFAKTALKTFPAIIDKLKEERFQVEKVQREASRLSGNVATVTKIQCGYFTAPDTFIAEHTWEPSPAFNYLSFYSDYFPKKVQVGIRHEASKDEDPSLWTGEYMDIPLNSIATMWLSDKVTEIAFLLKSPPKFYRRGIVTKPSGPPTQFQDETIVVSAPPSSSKGFPEYQRISVPTGTVAETIQLSRVYKFSINPIKDVKIFNQEDLENTWGKTLINKSIWAQKPIYRYSRITTVRPVTTEKDSISQLNELLKDCKSQRLVMLLSKLWMNGHFLPSEILVWLNATMPSGKTVFTQVQYLADVDSEHLFDALDIMCTIAGTMSERAFHPTESAKTTHDFYSQASEIYDIRKERWGESYPFKAPQNKVFVMGVLIYPSHQEIVGPLLTDSNRILRKYIMNVDNFIQVKFCDNEKRRLTPFPGCRIDETIKHIVKTLKSGLTFGAEAYEFLAFSNSSLKSNSQVWMMRPIKIDADPAITANTVRASIGDWTQSKELLKSPSKWAARIAQAFTSTIKAGFVDPIPSKWCRVADTRIEDYDATDGVGYISVALKEEINERLRKLNPLHRDSCAFQIRCMGAKGVVCVATDDVTNGKALGLRNSMIKFERPVAERNDHIEIEVVSWAKVFQQPKYNRQLIQVLENRDSTLRATIIRHFATEYENFKPVSKNKQMERLKNVTARVSDANIFGLNNIMSAFDFYKLPVDSLNNSFLYNVLQRLQRNQLQGVKFEARALIPGSYKVMGVCDEYGLLKENEVFVRTENKTISGDILIYRSPVIHPGDVRKVVALTDEQIVTRLDIKKGIGRDDNVMLKLDNVVVFPIKGTDRPLPNMLAGGDLDGDLYDILTVKSGLVSSSWTDYKPQEYSTQPAVSLTRESNSDDIADFIGTFIRDDCLGLVSNTRIVVADAMEAGPSSKEALEFSKACSIALDFQKSGHNVDWSSLKSPVKVKPDYFRSLLSVGFPDARGEYYNSAKLLGVLFRMAPWETDFPEADTVTDGDVVGGLHKILLEIDSSYYKEYLPDEKYLKCIQDYWEWSYRVELWDIMLQAQLAGEAVDEVDLFLLGQGLGSSAATERLVGQLKALAANFDQFILNLMNKMKQGKAFVNEAKLLYNVWISVGALDRFRYVSTQNFDNDFGISMAYLALHRFFYIFRTKKPYYDK